MTLHGRTSVLSVDKTGQLAFLVGQTQEQACQVFQEARARRRTKKSLWKKMRTAMELFRIPDWETMLALMTDPVAVDLQPEPLTG